MNVPPNTRKFSLSLAQQNHPLITRAGQEAKFIAYVPEAVEDEQVITLVDNRTRCHFEDGKNDGSISFDLFLAPVGYCEGKPVFAGDKLVSHYGTEYIVSFPQDTQADFEISKWPSKATIVETRMHGLDVMALFEDYDAELQPTLLFIANKAIERAILDGDVVPTSVVKSMLLSAHGDRNNITCEHMAQIAIDKYLESL